MKHLCLTLAFLVSTLPAQEPPAVSLTERGEMNRAMILQEAYSLGYSGDSVWVNLKAPGQVTMRFYQVEGGKATLVQSTLPTGLSKSFEIGFLFRQAKDGGRTLSFTHYDHERPTKSVGNDFPNLDGKAHPVSHKFPYALHSMASIRLGRESVVYYARDGGLLEDHLTLEQTFAQLGGGYVITAELHKGSE